jgi:hypothetical protein
MNAGEAHNFDSTLLYQKLMVLQLIILMVVDEESPRAMSTQLARGVCL